MDSVWACGLEFFMLRMAFFCMIKFCSMLDFDVELTMSGQYRRCEWKSDWYMENCAASVICSCIQRKFFLQLSQENMSQLLDYLLFIVVVPLTDISLAFDIIFISLTG